MGRKVIQIANIESNKSLILGNVYKPPNNTNYLYQSFTNEFIPILENLQRANRCVCTAGTEIGAGIYSTVSLFNHSCGPAVVRHMYGQTCVSRAIKTVYAGDEILSI